MTSNGLARHPRLASPLLADWWCVKINELRMKLTSVKLRRFQRHLLQLQVAKRAAMTCSRLADIENGTAEPQADELQRIARALGVSAQDLLASP